MKKYACECCGGQINPATMKCEYCGTQYKHDIENHVIRLETYTNPVDTFRAEVQYTQEYTKALDMAIKALEQQSCEDAISRQAAIDCLNADFTIDGKENMETVVDYINGAFKQIKALPSVTSQPKMGQWIYDKTIENWRCSECNETPKIMGYVGTANFMAEHFKYCNHCGAKMVEPQKSEVEE